MEESTVILSHLGLTSWQGALYLTDWLVAGNIEIKDCHIVELGAGTGFLGLHLLKSIPSIKSYNFTDGHRKYILHIYGRDLISDSPTFAAHISARIFLLQLTSDWNSSSSHFLDLT